MHLSLWQWALVGVCAVFVGMAKTGVPGLGIMVVPMMARVTPRALASAGLLLPLLCAADVFAVWYYRRHASAWALWRLFPFVFCGGVVGWLVMKRLDDPTLRFVIGIIVLGMVLVHLLRKHQQAQPVSAPLDRAAAASAPSPAPAPVQPPAPAHGDWVHGVVYGLVAGFATQVANAAGPVMSVYLLSMALPKDQFMGTGAWFFLVVNLAKIPGYLLLTPPIISTASLAVDAWVLPGIVIGALSGRRIYGMLPQVWFERVVLLMTTLSALWLLKPKLDAFLALAHP
jgi:uncharacterized membrane protein YfcA